MMPFRRASPSGSPLFSGQRWSEKSLQLPTSLPIRYQQLRYTSRKFIISVGLFLFCLIVLIVNKDGHSTGIFTEFFSSAPPAFEGSCHLNLTTLESFGLTNEITYARRYIRQVPFKKGPNPNAELDYVDELDHNIFTGIDRLTVSSARKDSIVDLEACSKTAMPMYMRQWEKPIKVPELVFGVASTPERLLDVGPTLALWLSNTGAQLIAIVPTGPRVPELRGEFERLGINATILTSNEQFLVNYFKLIEAFSAHGHPGAKWFTIIDDDTHYFSMKRFTDELDRYDPNKEVYIGAVSEDLRQIRWDGLFAFGGAGVTFSRALLHRLHENYYVCLSEQSEYEPGDVRLKRCIYRHTSTKMTMIEGLHQVDLEGESGGVMEGPRPPINWHHYRSNGFQNVHLISLAGRICGTLCLFQRWKFPVSSDFGYSFMTFHFGVSFIGYSVGIRPDLSKTEMTWREMPGSNFDHSLAPLRMNLLEGRDRFTYRLRGVGKDVDGYIKHTYVKYADKSQQPEKKAEENESAKEAEKRSVVTSVDEVLELVFI